MTEREAIVKAWIKEKKNGKLEITLITDEFVREDLLIQMGKTPRGIFSEVVVIADSQELFGQHLEELKI